SILHPRSSTRLMTRRLVVVGGGITGLAAAHRALELAHERKIDLQVLILEASQRLGGVISTRKIEGFLVEDGPDGFITEKPWALELCARLGLSARLIPTGTSHRSVYVVRGGVLQPLPEGFFLMTPTRLAPVLRTPIFSWRGKARLALEPLIPRRREDSDESLASFVRRRLGQEVLDRVAQPLVGGIYGADPEALSLAATLPRFLERERQSGSIIRAMRRERRRRGTPKAASGARYSLFVSFREGMQEIVDALVSRLPQSAIGLGKKIVRLNFNGSERNWALTQENEAIHADGVIVATPAYSAAQLLAQAAPELSMRLKDIRYASTATVNLAYRREEVPHPLDAFGFVVPAIEKRSIMACTFSSVKYPGRAPHGFVLLRAFVGGALQAAELERDDAGIESEVRRELADLLAINAAPLFCQVSRYPRSMPQYRVGHLDLIRNIDGDLDHFPRLALAGGAYGGVGIPDCVRSGEKAAEKIVNELQNACGSLSSEFLDG
ncbi:MAG: protoporphyrinogen oxidase, partial [Candidatus Binatia bacterium]